MMSSHKIFSNLRNFNHEIKIVGLTPILTEHVTVRYINHVVDFISAMTFKVRRLIVVFNLFYTTKLLLYCLSN